MDQQLNILSTINEENDHITIVPGCDQVSPIGKRIILCCDTFSFLNFDSLQIPMWNQRNMIFKREHIITKVDIHISR